MIIRPITKEDNFYDFIKLDRAFYIHNKPFGTLLTENFNKNQIRKDFDDSLRNKNCFFYCAEEDGKIVGQITGFIEKIEGRNTFGIKKIGDLNAIFVLKEYRNRGVAEKLVKEFENWLKDRQIKYVTTSANIKNEGAIRFHQKMGFKSQFIKFGKFI